MLAKPSREYTSSIRCRTFRASSCCLNSSLPFSGSVWPNAHWPSARAAGGAILVCAIGALSPEERGRAPAPTAGGAVLWTQTARPRGRGAGSVAPRTAAHARVRDDGAHAPTRLAEPGGDHPTRLSRERGT